MSWWRIALKMARIRARLAWWKLFHPGRRVVLFGRPWTARYKMVWIK